MKTLVGSVLVAAFFTISSQPARADFEQVPIPQEAENNPPTIAPPGDNIIGPVLLITCTVIAGCLIFWAYKDKGDPEGPHLYVLQEQTKMDGTWNEVGRITIALSPAKAKTLLAARIHKEDGFPHSYRIVDMGAVY